MTRHSIFHNRNVVLRIYSVLGNFRGMGYVAAKQQITAATELKNYLQPFADNDTIRNSIYSFVEMNPEKRMELLS